MKKKLVKISTKTILLVLMISILVSGCANKVQNIETNEELSFTDLSDEKLQDYILETLYSGINSEFSNEDYVISDITTVYISKEYLEELEYNSKANIYFGYTLDELARKFNGKKYVFEVGEDNQTIVSEFKDYENNFQKMLKNVMIGSGVIVTCATVSLLTGGTISIIFAASAKTGTTFALSSATFGGIASSAVEYYQTGDIKKSLEKGALEASESFKWGAIIGSVTGGITETVTQTSAAKELKYMNSAERGARSEARAAKKYGGKEQVSFLNGKEVNTSVSGATRPDLIRTVNGKLEAIEVKNYNLNSKESRKHLVKELKRQVTARVNNLPKGSTQRIVLDIQGRNYDKKILDGVVKGIKESCKDVYPDIPIDIMT